MGKDLQTLDGQNKLALWAGRISECRNSGQNVKTWCRENGDCEQTYYKWLEYEEVLDFFEQSQKQESDYEHGTEVTSLIVDGPALNPTLDDGCGRFKVKHFAVCCDRISPHAINAQNHQNC